MNDHNNNKIRDTSCGSVGKFFLQRLKKNQRNTDILQYINLFFNRILKNELIVKERREQILNGYKSVFREKERWTDEAGVQMDDLFLTPSLPRRTNQGHVDSNDKEEEVEKKEKNKEEKGEDKQERYRS